MTMYFILYLLIILMSFIGKYNHTKNNKKLTIILFSLIILVIGLRSTSMGNDLQGYIYSYRISADLSLKNFIIMRKDNYEIGFIIFIKVLSLINSNPNFFLFMCTAASVLPVAYCVFKTKTNSFLAIITYMAVPSFLMLYSGLRQSIALGICFYSILFVKEKKLKPFVITVLIAYLFHSSALLFLISYPVYWYRVNPKFRPYTLLIIVIIYIFRSELYLMLGSLLFDSVYMVLNQTNSYGVLLFLILNYVIGFLFSNKNSKYNYEMNGYLNILFIGIVCQTFASVSSVAMRVAEYYILILVLMVPKLIGQLKFKTNKFFLYNCYSIALILLGLLFLYQGGNSWAQSFPFYWFWQ